MEGEEVREVGGCQVVEGFKCEEKSAECILVLHRKPVELDKSRCDVFRLSGVGLLLLLIFSSSFFHRKYPVRSVG